MKRISGGQLSRKAKATLLSSHAGGPRAAAGDTSFTDQTQAVDAEVESQPAASPRTNRTGRTSPPRRRTTLTVTEVWDRWPQWRQCRSGERPAEVAGGVRSPRPRPPSFGLVWCLPRHQSIERAGPAALGFPRDAGTRPAAARCSSRHECKSRQANRRDRERPSATIAGGKFKVINVTLTGRAKRLLAQPHVLDAKLAIVYSGKPRRRVRSSGAGRRPRELFASASRQRPNQRARRVAPNSCFSRAYSRDGS